MGVHYKGSIRRLENQLDERMENLKSVMKGTKVAHYDAAKLEKPDEFASVSASDIRLAVDDFTNILREIKRTLK